MVKNTRLKAVLSLGIAIALLIILSELITAEDLNSKTLGGIIGSGIIWVVCNSSSKRSIRN
ncbi:hypothetical protein HY58_09790 [Flavihumibacter sp. ZG627]|nr:hypothetical protein HY58_09790 [Flavihumibacter sp. ZG627]